MLQLFEIVASLATDLWSDIKAKLRISTQALEAVNRSVAHGDGTFAFAFAFACILFHDCERISRDSLYTRVIYLGQFRFEPYW